MFFFFVSVVKTAWMTADIFCKAGSLANSVLTWFCTNHLKDALRANMYRSTDMTSGGGSSLATAKTTISLVEKTAFAFQPKV